MSLKIKHGWDNSLSKHLDLRDTGTINLSKCQITDCMARSTSLLFLVEEKILKRSTG